MKNTDRKFTVTITLGPKTEALFKEFSEAQTESIGMSVSATSIASALFLAGLRDYRESYKLGWDKSVTASCE